MRDETRKKQAFDSRENDFRSCSTDLDLDPQQPHQGLAPHSTDLDLDPQQPHQGLAPHGTQVLRTVISRFEERVAEEV